MNMPHLAFYGDSNLDYFKAEDDMCNIVFRTEGTKAHEARYLRRAIVCVNNHSELVTALEELLSEVDAHLDYHTDGDMQARAERARGILNTIRKEMQEAEHA